MTFTPKTLLIILLIVVGVLLAVALSVVTITPPEPTGDQALPPVSVPGDALLPVPEIETEDARTTSLETQSSSSETALIEQDLNATDLSNLDSEVDLINQELQNEGY
jgi:hypothetical protein